MKFYILKLYATLIFKLHGYLCNVCHRLADRYRKVYDVLITLIDEEIEKDLKDREVSEDE